MVRTFLLAGALAIAPVAGQQQQPPPVEFTVEVRGSIADFSIRMDAYAMLREEMQQGVPRLKVTDDPKEIIRAEEMLAARIRRARSGARRHDIFTQEIRNGFRKVLRPFATKAICEQIADDNPGEFGYRVNATYPRGIPVSTVPAAILAALPQLPPDVNYRFLETDLILHDTRANIILDRIDEALDCDD